MCFWLQHWPECIWTGISVPQYGFDGTDWVISHSNSFLLTYPGCNKQITKCSAKFLKLSQFSISEEVLSDWFKNIDIRLPFSDCVIPGISSCTVLVSGFCCSGECASALLSESPQACGQMAADEALQNLTLDSLLVNHSNKFNLFCKIKIIWSFKKKHLQLL